MNKNYIQNRNIKIFMVLGVLVLLVGGYFFMRKDSSKIEIEESSTVENAGENAIDKSSESSLMEDNEAEQATIEADKMERDDVLEVTVEGGAFYYKPNIIEAKVGQTVKVIFNSVDMQHDFDIDELNLDIKVIPGGDSITFEFVADQVGEFEYYCSVGQHRANGMAGTLIVTE